MAQKKEKDKRYAEGYYDGVKSIYEYTLSLLGKGHTASEVRLLLRAKVNDTLIELRKEGEPKKVEKEFPDIENGKSYLFIGELEDAISVFLSEVNDKNRSGLCIARETPDNLAELGFGEDIPIIWLTGEGAGKKRSEHIKTVTATDYTTLLTDVHEFLDGTPNGIILFEGIEYIRELAQEFGPVVKVINSIQDKVYNTGAALLIYVDGGAIDPGELGKLKRAARNVVP